jgi:hypothetical protein
MIAGDRQLTRKCSATFSQSRIDLITILADTVGTKIESVPVSTPSVAEKRP